MGTLNMMLNIMPYHCTYCVQGFKGMVHISDEARLQELDLIELQSYEAVKEPVWNTLEASDPIFVNGFGHGNTGIYTGDDTKAIFTDEECSILAGRVVYLLSCLTAVELGPAVINIGGITYIGFNISWTWLAQNITADPYDDWYAEGFYRSSNECPIALIQGDMVSVAKDRSIAEYNRWIEIWETERLGDPYAADAIGWLIYDRDGLTVLGDQSATIVASIEGCTIGEDGKAYRVQSLVLGAGELSGSKVTVALEMKVDGVVNKVYSRSFNRSPGHDPPGLWIINGTVGIHEALVVKVKSNRADDNGKMVRYDCILEPAGVN
ncbi:hypothetical protein ES703_116274 [subsurface metagenome]